MGVEGRGRASGRRRRQEIRDRSSGDRLPTDTGELVVQARGFEIEIESHDSFSERGQKLGSVGKQKGAADTAFIRVERDGFHGA